MDFSRPDQYDLSRVLWKVTHGKDASPPGSRTARGGAAAMATGIDRLARRC